MQLTRAFSGVMDTDNGPDTAHPLSHLSARNITFRGEGANLRAQNIKGTTLIPNALLPATGVNVCVGAFYDALRARVLWFNYNSLGKNGIYSYNTKTAAITRLLECGTHSAGDILHFDPNYPVHSVVLLYTTEDDGDVLHWAQRGQRPMKLNLRDAETGRYGAAWLEAYLTVARPMPLLDPVCVYVDDATAEMNNLYKRLFQFRYRWVYADDTRSTWGPYSKIPSPRDPDDLATEVDEQKNNRIDVTLQTGARDVVKIEVGMRLCLGTTWSDDYLVTTLDKDTLSISDNADYTHSFFNDGAYTQLPPEETDQLFDYVPKAANAVELLNGNVLVYGGITEGNTPVGTLDVTTTLSTYENADEGPLTASGSVVGRNYEVYFTGVPVEGDQVAIRTTEVDPPGPEANWSYVVAAGDTLEDIRDAFLALVDASAPDYSSLTRTNASGDPGLRISHADFVFITGSVTVVYDSTPVVPPTEIGTACYRPHSRHRFGLVYFDEFGVTPGVETADAMSVIIPELNTTGQDAPAIALIQFAVSHQPPVWAKKFALVRSANLTTVANFFGVSKASLKDTATTGEEWAYLDITNLQTNENNLSPYAYTPGDRIRVVLAPYGDAFSKVVELPLTALLQDPTIGSSAQTGTFLKFPYTADFASFGTPITWDHLYFEIYTPSATLSAEQTLYYEFGEQYEVGDAGLSTRYHKGMTQDQVAGSQPAIFQLSRGDYYLRRRKAPFGADPSETTSFWVVDRAVSDQFPSRVQGNGRAFVVDPYAREKYHPTLVRWGLDYQAGTNINRTNRFQPENFDEVDRAKGDIQALRARDRILRVFQSRGVAQYGVFQRFQRNNSGTQELVVTDEIITAGNAQYYQGEYGPGDQYTGVTSSATHDYFVDPVRGDQVRVGRDGLTPLTELYHGQYTLRELLVRYNRTFLRPDGFRARPLGVFDVSEGWYISVLPATTAAASEALAFSEKRTAYQSYLDLQPEWALSAEEAVYYFKAGRLYVNNSATYCNFFGVQYDAAITVAVNPSPITKKTWVALTQIASQVWPCPLVYTDERSYGSQRQESNLVAADFVWHEGKWHSSFQRDQHSTGGLADGDTLKGGYVVVQLKIVGASALATLSALKVDFQDSALTTR